MFSFWLLSPWLLTFRPSFFLPSHDGVDRHTDRQTCSLLIYTSPSTIYISHLACSASLRSNLSFVIKWYWSVDLLRTSLFIVNKNTCPSLALSSFASDLAFSASLLLVWLRSIIDCYWPIQLVHAPLLTINTNFCLCSCPHLFRTLPSVSRLLLCSAFASRQADGRSYICFTLHYSSFIFLPVLLCFPSSHLPFKSLSFCSTLRYSSLSSVVRFHSPPVFLPA